MSFASVVPIKGNENLINRLRLTVRSGKLFHGYIIEGKTDQTGILADAFISAALCERHDGDACGTCVSCRKIADGNSEDVVKIGVLGESVKDRDVEEMISRTMQRSYTGNRLFMVVRNADSMTLRAQNRLLKTLEEPPEGVTIILLAENSESLVQTIRSRCQLLKMFSDGLEGTAAASGSTEETDDAEFRRRAISAAAAVVLGTPAYRIWSDIESFTSSKAEAERFAAAAESFYRDILIAGYDSAGLLRINKEFGDIIEKCRRRVSPGQAAMAIESAEAAVKDLARNVSAGHAVKYMIFDIQEKINDNSNRGQV